MVKRNEGWGATGDVGAWVRDGANGGDGVSSTYCLSIRKQGEYSHSGRLDAWPDGRLG